MLRELGAKRVLFLQGPNGPFFRRFARDLRERGCEVTKVNFCAGDDLFYRGPDVVRFRGRPDEWPDFLRELLAGRRIEAIFLFGDGRPLHRAAVRIATEKGIPFWVLEEGYLRPDHVTIEQSGVNGKSRLPKEADFYRRAAAQLADLPRPLAVGNTFWHQALWTILSSVAVTFFFWLYPRYQHHRDVNALRQGFYWVRGAARKLLYAVRDRGALDLLLARWRGRYFLLPLQVHCDAQIQHSPYRRIEDLIVEVVASFAAHAPDDTCLVVKHHPHDRAYRDYGRLLRSLGRRHGCGARILYVHDLHLPTLLKHARGIITMNSTVGLSALHHGAPVKVLGKAVYDIPGLTATTSLADFLVQPEPADAALLAAFVRWLREANQINGSFYRRLAHLGTSCGLDASVLPERTATRTVQASREAQTIAATSPARSGRGG
ncbi:MAG: capsular biosynthesis protein [Deltaproteobacteria bacterium]|nr:capsular biosynthesis protein [Deltaproteobacteria bacterium]